MYGKPFNCLRKKRTNNTAFQKFTNSTPSNKVLAVTRLQVVIRQETAKHKLSETILMFQTPK